MNLARPTACSTPIRRRPADCSLEAAGHLRPRPDRDLRELVRGIHPPVLADRGLGDAVRALALDSPLDDRGRRRRCPAGSDAPVESAAYFAVGELLANAAKHSGARRVRIAVRHADGMLRITVTDDGHGGADPSRGTRPARHRAPAGYLRRDPRPAQPAGRADHRDPGDAVRVVIAEDLFLLRDGLIRLLEAHGFEIVAAVDNGPELLRALRRAAARRRGRRRPAAARPSPTRACRPRSPPAANVPGLPVLVLSQYVEQLYARELLADGQRRGRLPAQGPGVQRRPVRRRDPPGGRRRHRDGPRGDRQAARPQHARDEPLAELPRGNAKYWS